MQAANLPHRITQLLRAGKIDEASDLLETESETAEYFRAAGIFHAWRHGWQASQAAFQRALDFQNPDAEWWCDVGLALIGSGAAAQALPALDRSLALADSARTLVHYGEALELLSRDAEAYERFARAAELDPALADAVEGLVRAACKLGRDEESMRHARRAARLRRFDARSLQILADMQFYSANLETCLRTYRRAMKLNPLSRGIYSAYLFAAIHDPRQTPASLRSLHEEWFRRHAVHPATCNLTARRHKKLRIGYIGIEFRSSPTEYFLLPVLQAHDPDQFDIYCYHFSRTNDAATEKYKQAAAHWRDIATASEDEILRTIAADEIDILVDCSGHFAPHMQPVFARRAAPVQVALPIYPSTTGCPQMDYILTDHWATPGRAAEAQYVERAWRIPAGYVVYGPPKEAPDVDALPVTRNGCITFGLFQRPAKFNRDLWRAVACILQRTPNARLLIHHGTSDLEDEQSNIRRLIAGQAIASDRLLFIGRRETREHLEAVAQCDIALDTFPYSGHTTTGDALWMGVPVVTFAGDRHASRVSASFLSRLRLEDWIAGSVEDYVKTGVEKAGDLNGLAELRRELRARMAASSICRAELVVRDMEQAYRAMHAAATIPAF